MLINAVVTVDASHASEERTKLKLFNLVKKLCYYSRLSEGFVSSNLLTCVLFLISDAHVLNHLK